MMNSYRRGFEVVGEVTSEIFTNPIYVVGRDRAYTTSADYERRPKKGWSQPLTVGRVTSEIFTNPIYVIGAFNLQIERDKMNALKVVTISIAETLLRGGQQAIDAARAVAASRDLPGGTARDKVWYNLAWYAKDIAEAKKTAKSPNDLYASGADLKERVLQAFIEWNAAEEGAHALDALWGAMWAEIGAKLAAIPSALLDKMEEATKTVAWYAKATFWLGAVAVVGLTGAVGYGAYRAVSGR